jgi:hypothetical protein
MLRRSIAAAAFATVLLTLGLFTAGSALSTAITFGLLIFLAIATVIIGWDNLKESIVEEVEQAQGQVTSSFPHHESVDGLECRSWSPIHTDPVIRFQASPLADLDSTPLQLASAIHLSRQLPYETH